MLKWQNFLGFRNASDFWEARRVFVEGGQSDHHKKKKVEKQDQEIDRELQGDVRYVRGLLQKNKHTELEIDSLEDAERSSELLASLSASERKKLRETLKTVNTKKCESKIDELYSSGKEPSTEQEWQTLTSVPFAELAKKLSPKKLARYLSWLEHPRENRFLRIIDTYITDEFGPREIKLASFRGRALGERVGLLKKKVEGAKNRLAWDETRAKITEGQHAAKGIEEQTTKVRESTTAALAREEQFTSQGMVERAGEILKKIEKAGLTDTLASAKAIAAQQIQEAEFAEANAQKVDHAKWLNALEHILLKMKEEVERNISEALKEGADHALERIGELREELQPMVDVVKEVAIGTYESEEIKDYLQNHFKVSLDIAEHYCQNIKDLESGDASEVAVKETKVLDKLKPEDGMDDNSRILMKAILSQLHKINAEAVEEVSLYKQAKDKIVGFLAMHSQKDGEARERVGLEQSPQIDRLAEETGVDAGVIRIALANRDYPQPGDSKKIIKWARKHGIPTAEAGMIISGVSFSPEEAIFRGREDFVKKALENYFSGEGSDTEHPPVEELLAFTKDPKNANSFYHKFVGAKGKLSKLLLREATEQMVSETDFIFDLYIDAEKGETITDRSIDDAVQKTHESLEPIRQVLGEELKQAAEFSQRIETLRKEKIEPICDGNSHARDADRELKRLSDLFQKMSILGEDADSSELAGTHQLGRAEMLNLLADVTEKTKEFYQAAKPQVIADDLKRLFGVVSEKLDRAAEMSPEEFVERVVLSIKTEISTYDTQTVRESQDRVEEERKEKLQQFARWVNGDDSIDIFELCDNLENLNGTKVLHKWEDDDFKKEFGQDTKAKIKISSGGFEIYVKTSDWQYRDVDVLTSLRHEGWHALDKASKYDLSKMYFRAYQNLDPPKRKVLQQFLQNHGVTAQEGSAEFRKELLAYALSGELTNKNAEIAAALEIFLPQDWQEMISNAANNFSENGIQLGFFNRAETLSRSGVVTAGTQTLNPNNNPDFNFQFQTESDKIRKKLITIRKSGFAGASELADHTETQLNAMQQDMARGVDDRQFQEIQAFLTKTLKEQTNAAISEIAQHESFKKPFFSEVWSNTTMLSLADIGTLFSVGKDYFSRKHDRKSKLRAGKAGKALINNINRTLANEYDNKREEAEKEEVGNYEKGLDNKDAWQIMDRIGEVKNQDELKACLNTLAKQGQIDWYDRRIWRALEKFQSTIKFHESDADDANALRIKLKRACGIIWDNDYFNDTDRQNGDAYQSEKQKYKKEVDANLPIMDKIICSMLIDKKNGGLVDPQRFEAYIEGAIDAGKSTPENVTWYLFQGVHYGILNLDRINYFDANKLNSFPPVEWFYRVKPTLDQVHAIASRFPSKKGSSMEMPPTFMDWFWTTIMTNQYVRERVRKSSSQAGDKWDHDWATTFFSVGDANTAKILTSLDNGKPPMPPTMYANALIGQWAFISGLARNPDHIAIEAHQNKKDFLKEEIIRHLGFTAMYNSVVTGQVKEKGRQGFYTMNQYELNTPARADFGNIYKQGITSAQYIEKQKRILATLDPIFSFVNEPSIDDTRAQAIGQSMVARFGAKVFPAGLPSNGVELMQNLHGVIQAVVDQDPGSIQRVMNKVYEIDQEDYGAQESQTRMNQLQNTYELGINWREHHKEQVGDGDTDAKGMYALAGSHVPL